MQVPQISVVVPAYNAGRYLRQTLDSVLAQTNRSWEMIVVDDGSQDETAAIAQGYATEDQRVSVHRQRNAGVAAARNAGLLCAHPDAWAIMFLDADDVLVPDALQTLSDALSARPEAVGAHGQARFIASSGEPTRPGEAEAWGRERFALVDERIVPWPEHLPTTLSVLVLLNRLRTPGCALVRREAVSAVGGFDTDPKAAFAEDYDFWLRLACRGDLLFLDRVVVSYRLHEDNRSGNLRRTDDARWYVHRKLAGAPELTGEQRRLVKHGLRYARLLGSRYWFGWAVASARRGQLVASAKYGRHALSDLVHFCATRPA